MAEEALYARGNHHADAGKPADRLALHQADGGQSDREHGRRGAADVAGEGARRRRARRPPDLLLGGASAEEPRDYLARDQFYESHPQNAVLKAVMDLVEGDGKKFDAIELYSCFPCVPKMARRTLGLGPDVSRR